MLRRDFLHRAMCGAAALSGLPVAGRAATTHGCYAEKPAHIRCQIGFPGAPFIEPQPCRSLSWANCIAYTLGGFGAKLTAASVLHRMETTGDCRVRPDASIIMSAVGQWVDDSGRPFFVRVRRLPDLAHGSYTSEEFAPLVDALSRRPLIVGTPGHSRVLTEMSYVDAPMVLMRHDELVMRDPWKGTSNLVRMSYTNSPERMFAFALDVRAG